MISVEILKKNQKYLPEFIAFILYICALILIMCYHEPCIDEAQAWLIARDATIKLLLTSITHYEGHPPIWYLILMPFAKLGVPFELGIKVVNCTLATVAMGILIFKAPFPRIIRCTIPFTYFFFYQYGVVSRTYSLMLLGFVLSAMFYRERNEKPFRFITALALICGASAYGIVISAGIAVVWLWEIFDKTISFQKISLFLQTRRFYALLILLIYNVLLIICIYPCDATYRAVISQNSSNGVMIFYMLFVAPADATCTDVFSYAQTPFWGYHLIPSLVIGCLINTTLCAVSKTYKKLALFVVPYLLFAIFAGVVHFWPHHIGILTMFYMFLLWCCFDERSKNYENPTKSHNCMSGKSNRYVQVIGVALISLTIGTSIYWSGAAAVNEINLIYNPGREAAQFIKDNQFDNLNILAAWDQTIDANIGELHGDYNSLDGLPTLAYFDKNIFYNFNYQANNQCYLIYKTDYDGFSTKRLIDAAYPDVLFISDVRFKYTYGPKINIDDYALVESVHSNRIWKDKTIAHRQYIFIKRDLLKNYPTLKELNLDEEIIPEG